MSKRVILICGGVILAAVVFVLFGALLAIIVPLALWKDWLGLRSRLAALAPAIGTLRPWILAIGSFLIIGGTWDVLAQSTRLINAKVGDVRAGSTMQTLVTPVGLVDSRGRLQTSFVPTSTSVPPTVMPISPTSTPVPPTATKNPPTSAPRSSATVKPNVNGIGLSRQAIQSVYEKPEIGFTFKSGAPVDGQPQVIGTSPNGSAILQIIGPPEDVQEVSILVVIPKDRQDVVIEDAVLLVGLAKVAAPDWDEGPQWVANHIKDAIREGDVTTSHGKLKMTLQTVKELGMIGLTVEGKPPTTTPVTPTATPVPPTATATTYVIAGYAGPVMPSGLASARIVKVVDGDTVDVILDGKTVTLRLIGMDSPEVVDPRKPVQCFGREASNRGHQILDGQTVYLEADPTQGERDKYGRTLRYLWLPDGRSYEWTMIDDGYAHEYTYDAPYRYQADFKAAQRDAMEHNRGLWSSATCNGDTTQAAAGQPIATSTPRPVAPTATAKTVATPSIVYYPNCAAVKAAGKAPLHRGDPDYRAGLDRDNDGIACE